jgi:acyl-CoA dehydrogenase
MLKNYFLSDEERSELALFTESIERFCDEAIEPNYARWEKEGIVPRELWRQFGEAGLLCTDIPEECGGFGASPRFSFAVCATLARRGYGGLSSGVSVHNDIVAWYVYHLGNEAQRQQWLPKMASGEVVGAIGMTEPGAGSDLKSLRTSARREGDEYVINGSKIFISNGQHCDLLVLAAKTDPAAGAKGVSLFLVDTSLPGFARGANLDKIGHHAADTSELFFDNLRVPASALLGEAEGQGFIQIMQELPRERLAIAIQSVAAAQGARDLTVRYVGERQAFGAPIAQLQNTRFKLAQVETEITASTALVDACTEAFLRGELSAAAVSAAKLQSSEMLGRVADECLQLFGGYGYMTEYPVSRFWTDARVIRIYGGTSEIMKELVARSVLGR